MFPCEICSESFFNKTALTKHAKNVHNLNARSLKCRYCEKTFESAGGLRGHEMNQHKDQFCPKMTGRGNLTCGICSNTFRNSRSLCEHVSKKHNRPDVQVQEISFSDISSFDQWKVEWENIGKFNLVKESTSDSNSCAKHYYRCHRSGFFRSESTGKRAPKCLGSNKTGFHCSCFAVVSVDKATQKVSATYCLQHYGHDDRLARLRLPQAVRTQIQQYVTDNRDMKWILNKIRSDFDEEMHRKNLLQPADIRNITQRCGLKTAVKHQEDAVSVRIWVEQNPSEFFCYSPLQEDNSSFMLGMQTQFQLEMLKLHGRSLICVDATHCTTKYKLLLVTVLVVDQFGKGLPVAWLMCSNENEQTITQFFTALKARTGEFKTKIFMSDDAPAYINAWRNVFGDTSHLLCTWHVLKNWRKNLTSKVVSGKEYVALIWRELYMLIRETDEVVFRSNLSKLLYQLEKTEKEFHNYFCTTYCRSEERILAWAYVGRVGSKINVNMYLEAFHKTFKHDYLGKRVNLRLDNLIEKLLIAAKRYLLDYVVNVEKPTACSSRISQMHDRHRNCQNMKTSDVREEKDEDEVVSFTVPSATDSSKEYKLSWSEKYCGCSVRCQYCKVCPDMFSCNCRDSLFRAYACKHMHLLQIYLEETSSDLVSTFDNADETSIIDGTNFVQKNQIITNEESLAMVLDDVDNIKQFTQKHWIDLDSTQHQQVADKLREFKSLISIMISNKIIPRLPATSGYSSAKHTVPQQRFETNKKRKASCPVFSRPTAYEEDQIQSHFNEIEQHICAKCFKKEDSTCNETVDLIACDRCNAWFHTKCIIENSSADAEFLCEFCKKK